MLISIAIDFHDANVATRERFHPSLERVAQFYNGSRDASVAELALLATCNRTELYAWLSDTPTAEGLDRVYGALAHRWMGSEAEARNLLAATSRRGDIAAARHLVRVATGLESQVLGDGQILGQVRGAYRLAAEMGAAGPVLHRLFDTALRAGKRVQSDTTLSLGRQSIGAAAASIVSRRFRDLHHVRVVVVGAGKTGQRALRQVAKLGCRDLVLVNRTEAHAAAVAADTQSRTAPFDALYSELAMADVGIVATGALEPIVLRDRLELARANCATAGLPLLLIDVGVPRNVQATASALAGVTLIDLDALHVPVTDTNQLRRDAVPAAERIVDAELADFCEWLATASARAAIRPLRDALIDVCRREVAFAAGDAVADRTAERIATKMMARPMTAVRRALARGESVDHLTTALMALFATPGGLA
jgi:glutamyl-tRNA reductase